MQDSEVICRLTLNTFEFMPIASSVLAHQLFVQVQVWS
jgi:hypothetical protein